MIIQITYEYAFIWPSNEEKTNPKFYIITSSYIAKEMQAYAAKVTRYF